MRALFFIGLLFVNGTYAFAQKGMGPILPGGNSKDPISIDAAKLDYYDKEQKLVYSGNVTAKQGPSILRAQSLTLFLTRGTAAPAADQPSTGPAAGAQLKRMEAAGNVIITSQDQVGMGDRASYDKGENKIYLFGNVSLSQGPNITKGEKLVYDLTTSQAHVEGTAKGRVMSIFTPGSGEDEGKKPAAPKPSGR